MIKIMDPCGEQVCDLVAYNLGDKREHLSSGRTIDYNETIYQTTGHALYSNQSRVMLNIVEDTVGRHDFLLTPCSLEMFHVVSKTNEYHPSCQENLEKALAAFDIGKNDIPTTFNIFMNVHVKPDGGIHLEAPLSKAGDYIVLEAAMDLIIALTACSDEQTNHGSLKPIAYEII